jgi:hypothetical protein
VPLRGDAVPGRESLAGAIPLYCINLATSLDRRERMRRRFEHFGLLERVRFIRAVEKDSARVARYGALTDRPYDEWSYIAAVLSHLRALRTFLRETPPSVGSVIVFEDDVRLHQRWHELLEATLANLPEGTPACALGYSDEDWDLPPELWQGFSWAGREPEQHNLVGYLTRQFQSHAYWISRTHARRVLREFPADPGRFPFPESIEKVPGGLASFPSLAVQDGSVSTIAPGFRWAAIKPADLAWEPQDYHSEDGTTLITKRAEHCPTVALCATVWNDAPMIEQWARSLTGLIDTWLVCDTGSSDGTAEQVAEAFAGVPGQLHHDPWVNGAANRTLMLERARGMADYLLLLDPRHSLRLRYQLGDLDADAYAPLVLDATAGWQPMLVRADLPWHAAGVGTPRLARGSRFDVQPLDHLVARPHEDEAHRLARLRRDLDAVEHALGAGDEDADLLFEAAELCRELGDGGRAADLYRRRCDLGGDRSQVWEAMLRYGELVGDDDWDATVRPLLDAWEFWPERAEPLWCLAHGYRRSEQFTLALLFAEEGLELPVPRDVAAQFRPVYDWKLAFEWSLAEYACGDPAEAAAAAWPLLEIRSVGDADRKMIRQHLQQCVDAAAQQRSGAGPTSEPLQTMVPSAAVGELRLDLDPSLAGSALSVASDGDGLRAIVRLNDDGDPPWIGYAELRLDGDLGVIGGGVISDSGLPDGLALDAFERLHLVELGGEWLAVGYPGSSAGGGAVLLPVADGVFGRRVRAEAGGEVRWAPFVADGHLLFLSGFGPVTVLRIDLGTGVTLSEETAGRLWKLEGDRPASQGVRVADGTLFVSRREDGFGGAQHRFVLLDDRLEVVGASRPFVFLAPTGEFCSGLACVADDVVVCFEQTAPQAIYLARLPYRDLAATL